MLLLVCLAWGMIPGLAVAAENLWSVATTGHVAHAPAAAGVEEIGEPGGDLSPVDSEHGCSGAFHFCFCHQSLMSAPSPVVTGAPSVVPTERAACGTGRIPSDPVLSGLERPPRT